MVWKSKKHSSVCQGKYMPNALKGNARNSESKLEDGQCGFHPGRSTSDQIFTPKQIFEKSWEYGKDLFACFVDHEKTYDWVPRYKLWKVLREYGDDGQLLCATKSFYCRPEVCIRVNGKQSKPFLKIEVVTEIRKSFYHRAISFPNWKISA